MPRKTGKSYEILTQAVFGAILGQKDIPNLVVKHNVRLRGKHTTHQIDVYWKFEIGGAQYETIVQTKDWDKPVDQMHLLAFKGTLDDLLGQPKGIFVTRSGFQQGATEFAFANGIMLYELKDAEPPPLQITVGAWIKVRAVRVPLHGLVRTTEESDFDASKAIALGFEYEVFTPHFSKIEFQAVRPVIGDERPEANLGTIKKVELPPVPYTQIIFYDDNGTVVGNLAEVFGKIIEQMKNEGIEKQRATHTFDTFVSIRGIPALTQDIEINSVSVSVDILRERQLRRGKMSNFSQFVLRQIVSDRTWWIAATPEAMSELSAAKLKSGRNRKN